MPDVSALFQRVREFALKHDGAMEKLSHGAPAFFVDAKGGRFAVLWDNHHGDGNHALLVAAPPGIQQAMVEGDPARFYRPPYFGPDGWVGVRLDVAPDWAEIEAMVDDGFQMVAAKRRRGR